MTRLNAAASVARSARAACPATARRLASAAAAASAAPRAATRLVAPPRATAACLPPRALQRAQLSTSARRAQAEPLNQEIEFPDVERVQDECDVCIVGGGPAGLSAAIQLMKMAKEKGEEIRVVVLEKGAEVGTDPVLHLWPVHPNPLVAGTGPIGLTPRARSGAPVSMN